MLNREIVTFSYLLKRFGHKAYDGLSCPDKFGFCDVFIDGRIYRQFKDLFGFQRYIRIK